MQPIFSIIIVTWNCKGYLEQCLASIKASQSKYSYEIIVVDNNSSDGTVDFLKQKYLNIRVIVNSENRGFAAGNNQALREVRGEFVVLLNPDTIVHSGAFDAMVEFLEGHRDVWVVGPKILNADGTEQRTGVRFPNTWNILFETLFLDRLFATSKIFGRHRELYIDSSIPREVDYLQGSCLMVSTDAIGKIGLLDEQYFMYFEETDWCYRMKQRGGKVYFVPSASIAHFGGGEIGHYDEKRVQHYHRSLLLFYQKYYSTITQIMLRLLIIVRSFIRVIAWVVYGLFRPSKASRALSSIKGHFATLSLVFQKV